MSFRLQRVIAVFAVGGFIMSQLSSATPRGAQQVRPLSPASQATSTGIQEGFKAERDLSGGEQHTYPLTLKAGDYLKLTVEQRGIDVVVRVLGSDRKKLAEVDSPNGTQGPESLSLIVEQAGDSTLEVVSVEKTARAGKYELNLEALHLATDQDQATLEIEVLVAKAEKLRLAGKSNDALPLVTQALEKSEQVFGKEHHLVATSLNNLAELFRGKGEYLQAEPLYLRSLAIREKTLGPDHPSVAICLNNLAGLLRDKGDYPRAEPLFLRSLAIREKAFDPNHPEVAESLNNLAVLYRAKGDFIRAEPLYQRSLAIFEKVLGPDHRDVAKSLNNLAVLYWDKGDLTRAEPLLLRALAIKEKTLGPDHPDVAYSLNALAGLYRAKGDYAQAEPLYLRSLAIFEKVLGPNHPFFAGILNNLAVLYWDKGDHTRAEPLYQRALAIREKALGPAHPDVVYSLNALAFLYLVKGDYAQSEPLSQRALAISEKALGPDHPSVAKSLINLAQLYYEKGDSAQAESMFKRALAIREKVLGPDHPVVATSLSSLAVLYQTRGETAQAIQYWTRCNDATERDLLRNLAAGSEHQKALYLKQTAWATDQSISLHVQDAPQDVAALQTALTVILRRKGRTLDAMTNAIAVLRSQSDPETQKLLDDYTSIVGQLSVQTLRGPGKEKPEVHLANLKSLEAEKERLENDISRRSGEFKVQTTPITLEGVQKLIPADTVLVEYVLYRPYNTKTRKYGTPRYVAYVVKSGSGFRVPGSGSGQESGSSIQNQVSPSGTRHPEPRTLSYVDLGEAEPIDRAVATLRQVLSDKSKSVSTQVKPAAQALDKLVMNPVRALVGKAKHLLISPDGDLNLIPFSALADEKGQYLIEKYTLTYLTSGRDLLRLNVKLRHQEPTLVLADPDYASGPGPVVAGQSLKPLLSLPATTKEGQEIQKLMANARLVVKTEASESIIKAVRRPYLLHVATHGYFLTDTPSETPLDPARNLLNEPVIKAEQLRIENPLLRSWLFFAGANHGGSEDNDGVMTALEGAQLNLWGTKLVTLSACDTGLGDVKNGDGVYGLRRALVLAGSEAQMMSLWPVSDQGTQELMVEYYTRLKAGEGRSDALRKVQLKMLKNPKRQHPFYWASFIQSGEWANLDGVR